MNFSASKKPVRRSAAPEMLGRDPIAVARPKSGIDGATRVTVAMQHLAEGCARIFTQLLSPRTWDRSMIVVHPERANLTESGRAKAMFLRAFQCVQWERPYD